MKNIKIISFLAITAAALVHFGQGCSGNSFEIAPGLNVDDSQSLQFSSTHHHSKLESEPALQNFEQILASMINLTGLDMVSYNNQGLEPIPANRRITAEYISRNTLFTNSPDPSGLSSPLLLSATSLASTVCDALIEKERVIANSNDRMFFKDVDFTKAVGVLSDKAFDKITDKMAFEFWSRELTEEEREAFSAAKIEYKANLTAGQSAAAQTRGLVLMTCTAALSSYDSISFN